MLRFKDILNVLVAIPTRTYKHKQHGPRSMRIYIRGLAFKSNWGDKSSDLVKRRSSPI